MRGMGMGHPSATHYEVWRTVVSSPAGPEQSPGQKQCLCILSVTEHLWLKENY